MKRMDSAMPTGLVKEGTHGPGWQGAMILRENQSMLRIASCATRPTRKLQAHNGRLADALVLRENIWQDPIRKYALPFVEVILLLIHKLEFLSGVGANGLKDFYERYRGEQEPF